MSAPRLIALALALALIALVLLSPNADAATFYIDPDCATPGDGTSDTCAGAGTDPFDNWTDVTWTAGNSYFQKAGTIANEATVTIQATGTAGNVITMGAYDVTTANPYAKINCAGGGPNGINVIGRQYITVQDFETYDCSGDGIKFRGNDTLEIRDVTIRRVYSHDNGDDGVAMENQLGNDPVTSVNLLIEDCIAADNGRHGCSIEVGAVGATIRRCTAIRNSQVDSGWGCYISPHGYATKLQTLESGTLFSVDKGVHSGAPIRRVFLPARPDTGPFELTEGTFGALATNEWAEDVGNTELQLDLGVDITGLKIIFNIDDSTDAVIEDSIAYGTNDNYDGVGIGCDAVMINCTLRRNYSYNNVVGFSCHACDGANIYSNIAANNTLYGIRTSTVFQTVKLHNNTFANNATAGIFAKFIYTGDTLELKNNIVIGGTSVLISETITGGSITDDYTRYFGQTGTAYPDISAGANSVNEDPLLSGAAMNAAMDFTLQSGSPAVRAGTCIYATGCIPRDYYNRAPRVPPDIGAIQRKASD